MKSSNETTKNLIVNNVIVNLNVIGALIEGGVVSERNHSLISQNTGMDLCSRKHSS